MTNLQMKPPVKTIESNAALHCPICTHTVQGIVLTQGRVTKVKPGQKCSRCSSSLDPAYIIRYDRAA
ncbi:MAG: hypothetical protein JO051_16420 [Acidobacteriaceae bacterium]|nr:hypothetical protein [Acidobacteriaceae bacterium]